MGAANESQTAAPLLTVSHRRVSPQSADSALKQRRGGDLSLLSVLSLTLSLALSLFFSLSLSLSLSLITCSLWLSHCLSLSHSLSRLLSHLFDFSNSLFHFFEFFHSLSHFFEFSRLLSHSLSHYLHCSLSHGLSLSRSPALPSLSPFFVWLMKYIKILSLRSDGERLKPNKEGQMWAPDNISERLDRPLSQGRKLRQNHLIWRAHFLLTH